MSKEEPKENVIKDFVSEMDEVVIEINRDEAVENEKGESLFDNDLLSEFEQERFKEAAVEANFDVSLINGLEQIEDWSSGKRYHFIYKGNEFTLYMLENGYVAGINLSLNQIYKDGYEALNVEDFILDLNIISNFETNIEPQVKKCLNYPDTADFHWVTNSSVSRYGELYNISSNVIAKNGFGVKETVPFNVQIKYDKGTDAGTWNRHTGRMYQQIP